MFKIGDKVVVKQGALTTAMQRKGLNYDNIYIVGSVSVEWVTGDNDITITLLECDTFTHFYADRFELNGEKTYTQAQMEELIEKVAKQFDWLSFGDTTVGGAFKKRALELMKEM